jgi:hypothetical protein
VRPVGAGLIVGRPHHRETPARTRLLAPAGRELSVMAPITPRLLRARCAAGHSAASPSAHQPRDPRHVSRCRQRSPRGAASSSRVIPTPAPGSTRQCLLSVPAAAHPGNPGATSCVSSSAARPGSPRCRLLCVLVGSPPRAAPGTVCSVSSSAARPGSPRCRLLCVLVGHPAPGSPGHRLLCVLVGGPPRQSPVPPAVRPCRPPQPRQPPAPACSVSSSAARPGSPRCRLLCVLVGHPNPGSPGHRLLCVLVGGPPRARPAPACCASLSATPTRARPASPSVRSRDLRHIITSAGTNLGIPDTKPCVSDE